jgi:hypothetical protein
MIVSLHVATGGLAGLLTGSRLGAAIVGPVLHALGDRMPHEDIDSYPFETISGFLVLSALAARYGPLHPVTIGAAASSAPDLEHVLPHGRRNLFPSHRVEGWHRAGGVPAWAQLIAAGALAGYLLSRRG